MLTALKTLGTFQRPKYLFHSRFRCVYSGRAPQVLSKIDFGNAGNNEKRKDGYGDKEICLLGPIDIRTPLPGNMGIPPISMLFTTQIQQLPKIAGENNDVIQSPTPEERYHIALTQAAFVATEKTFKSFKCEGFRCPQLLKKDFCDLFPGKNLIDNELTVIIFCQNTENDMSVWTEAADIERENLEFGFTTAADVICDHLNRMEYWADFIHPRSGKPHFSPLTSSTMFETDTRYRHFGFSIEDLGCCKVISHHLWGTNIFVGAIFTNAALESRAVQEIIQKNRKGFLSVPDIRNVI